MRTKTHDRSPLDTLSPRERQVLRLVVDGHTSKEIGALMGVSPSSIDSYRSRVMRKLDCSNIATLVRLAIRYGLVEP